MENLIGSCGIDCSECPAYIATKNNDAELKKQTAEEWTKMFQHHFEPKDINCMGCQSDILSGYCTTCNIRACNVNKGSTHCSDCADYSCSIISEFHTNVPAAKIILDGMRK